MVDYQDTVDWTVKGAVATPAADLDLDPIEWDAKGVSTTTPIQTLQSAIDWTANGEYIAVGGWGGVYATWLYRRPITINNTSGGVLTDYQVLVELTAGNHTYAHSEADGADIRFSQDDGVTPLDYWIEEWIEDGTSKIWIKIDSIPIGESTCAYLYCGQSEASDESDGNNTFVLFDDFNDNSLTGWTWEEGVAGNQAVEQNQRLEITNALNSYGHIEKDGLPNTFLAQVKIHRTSLPADQTWAPGLVIWFNAKDWANILLAGSGSQFFVYRVINDSKTQTSGGNHSVATWYWLRIRSNGTNIYFEYSTNGTDWTTLSTIAVPATWIIDANSLVELGSGYEQGATYPNPKLNNNYSSPGANWTTYFDDFRVRKLASTEPTNAVGAEVEPARVEITSQWAISTEWDAKGLFVAGELFEVAIEWDAKGAVVVTAQGAYQSTIEWDAEGSFVPPHTYTFIDLR